MESLLNYVEITIKSYTCVFYLPFSTLRIFNMHVSLVVRDVDELSTFTL